MKEVRRGMGKRGREGKGGRRKGRRKEIFVWLFVYSSVRSFELSIHTDIQI